MTATVFKVGHLATCDHHLSHRAVDQSTVLSIRSRHFRYSGAGHQICHRPHVRQPAIWLPNITPADLSGKKCSLSASPPPRQGRRGDARSILIRLRHSRSSVRSPASQGPLKAKFWVVSIFTRKILQESFPQNCSSCLTRRISKPTRLVAVRDLVMARIADRLLLNYVRSKVAVCGKRHMPNCKYV